MASGPTSEPIRVTVRLFSHLRHQLGCARLELELPAGSTTADLETRVRELLGPALRRMVFRLAVNQRFVDEAVPLRDGDDVGLLPPMQGGST